MKYRYVIGLDSKIMSMVYCSQVSASFLLQVPRHLFGLDRLIWAIGHPDMNIVDRFELEQGQS